MNAFYDTVFFELNSRLAVIFEPSRHLGAVISFDSHVEKMFSQIISIIKYNFWFVVLLLVLC